MSLAVLLVSACTGVIGDALEGPAILPSGPPPSMPGPGSPEYQPGAVPPHRLNNAEYRNTVRDLLDTAVDAPAFASAFAVIATFPEDGQGAAFGFDNDAQALRLESLHLDMYFRAAEALVNAALGTPGPGRDRIVTCGGQDSGCLQQILGAFARRAWRRPVAGDEVQRLIVLANAARTAGGAFEDGLRTALQGVLISPHFLFRVEIDPAGLQTKTRTLDDWELASRLSYFLWSSMPDDELYGLAGQKQLAANVSVQITRMLKSPKAGALIDNYAGQWLALRELAAFQPDPTVFPRFNLRLLDDMASESRLLMRDFFFDDQPFQRILAADYTYLNARLATHYGVAGVTGTNFRKVSLDAASYRLGLLTHGSLLALTSHPEQTSPVKRGRFVLHNLLCSSPLPPPTGLVIPALKGDQPAAASLRAQLEQHRTNPVCAPCHREMDPIGLAFENYDAVGAYRTKYAKSGQPVDAAGVLPTGESFRGAVELAGLLARDPRFAPCALKSLMTYAVGRALDTDSDTTELARLGTGLNGPARLEAFVRAVIDSHPFRTRLVTQAL